MLNAIVTAQWISQSRCCQHPASHPSSCGMSRMYVGMLGSFSNRSSLSEELGTKTETPDQTVGVLSFMLEFPCFQIRIR